MSSVSASPLGVLSRLLAGHNPDDSLLAVFLMGYIHESGLAKCSLASLDHYSNAFVDRTKIPSKAWLSCLDSLAVAATQLPGAPDCVVFMEKTCREYLGEEPATQSTSDQGPDGEPSASDPLASILSLGTKKTDVRVLFDVSDEVDTFLRDSADTLSPLPGRPLGGVLFRRDYEASGGGVLSLEALNTYSGPRLFLRLYRGRQCIARSQPYRYPAETEFVLSYLDVNYICGLRTCSDYETPTGQEEVSAVSAGV